MGYHDKNMIDEGRFVSLLQEAVQHVKTEEDPLVLNQYKKLFKKNVPFSLRMYVAAYLAKNAAGSYRPRREHTRGKFSRDNQTFSNRATSTEEGGEERPRHRTVIDEAAAATIFISVGRNRRVFPKDLIRLIVENTELDRERIGDIRVLDNYSFVQLFKEDADKVIKSLNEKSYRGRQLTVSYSSRKTEEEGVASEESHDDSTDSVGDEE